MITKVIEFGENQKFSVEIHSDKITLDANGEISINKRNTGIVVKGNNTYGTLSMKPRDDLKGLSVDEVANKLALFRY